MTRNNKKEIGHAGALGGQLVTGAGHAIQDLEINREEDRI